MTETRVWAEYRLVKYQADVRRGEPINIGVIVTGPNGASELRFIGETEPGRIDGHAVRGRFGSLENYKRWVAYFYRSREQGRLEHAISRWYDRRAESSYFIGAPAHAALSDDNIETIAAQVFHELVARAKASTDDSDPEDSRLQAVFRQLNIVPSENPSYSVTVGTLNDAIVAFDYGFQNGRLHLMDEFVLSGHKQARMTAYDFASRARVALDAHVANSFIGFYDLRERPIDPQTETALEYIETFAHTINLADDDILSKAAEALGVA
jgi:hypothetical protein